MHQQKKWKFMSSPQLSAFNVVWHFSFTSGCLFGFKLQQCWNTHLSLCPMIPDVEVSLSHLSHSVINDLAELRLSEGDLRSQFLLLSACQLRESFFSLQAGSKEDFTIFLPVLFLYIFPVKDNVWWDYSTSFSKKDPDGLLTESLDITQ